MSKVEQKLSSSSSQGRGLTVLRSSVRAAIVIMLIFGIKAVIDESAVRMSMAIIGEGLLLGAYWSLNNGREGLALNLFFLMSWLVFMGANITFGGSESLIMCWWIIFVCLAGLMGGHRYGVAWGAIAFLSMVLLWGLNRWVPSIADFVVDENKSLQLRMHMVAQLVIVIAIVRSFLNATNTYEEQILSYTQELECEVDKRRVAEEEAKSSQKATVQFFANMSHELRTPLNCIIGFSARLVKRNSCSNEKDTVALERIQSNAKGLANLVDEIFILSNLSGIRLERQEFPFTLDGIIHECVAAAEPLANEFGLSVCFDAKQSISIKADRVRLHQAILNILYFSIRQTREGGLLIEQSLIEEGGVMKAQIRISDTSAGIPAGQIESLFEAHYQFVRDSNKDLPISALALVISARLVELHQGRISVESELKKGTQFTVILPLE